MFIGHSLSALAHPSRRWRPRVHRRLRSLKLTAIDWHRATDGLQSGDVHVTVRYRSFVARSVRFVIGESNQFRLGVDERMTSADHNRPSVYRQRADVVSRGATNGAMETQLARVLEFG